MPWSFSQAITIAHTNVSGGADLSNYPLLFHGGYAELKTVSSGGHVTNLNGYDIIFASDSLGASPLAFQRMSYRAYSGAICCWVNIPTLSHTVDTTIYILYGNSAITTDQQNPTAVWDSNYKGVWHTATAAAIDTTDSTSNGNNGVLGNGGITLPTLVVSAPFGGGSGSFNGAQAIYLPSLAIATHTVEAWVYPTSSGHTGAYFAGPNGTSAEHRQQPANHLEILKEGAVSMAVSTGTLTMNAWNHVAITYDGTNIAFYIAGAAAGTGSNVQTFAAGNYYIGESGNSENWIGDILEVRWSNVVRTAGWIATSYSNQNAPQSFYTVSLTYSTPAWLLNQVVPCVTVASPSVRGFYTTVWSPTGTTPPPSPYLGPAGGGGGVSNYGYAA
jgi:hypothetical protein